MKIPEIPNNSLTEEIKEIVRLCQELDNKYFSEFSPPETEEAMTEWEKKNGISIPESYKDWLRFSGSCEITNDLAHFYGTGGMIADYEYLPDDLVYIGDLIGDGEMLCFSKTTGKIIRYDHGVPKDRGDFKDFLNRTIIRMLRES